MCMGFIDLESEEKYYSYEPKEFFSFFREISNIPRPSGGEENVALYLKEFAKKHGFYCIVDEKWNVFMTVPASVGYEDQPSVLLQSHTDMIWKKDSGVEFDFRKEPIKFKIEDDKLYADGTTLGTDNGKGIAIMLAIADSDEIPHPKLELLFTAEEETGLIGIREFDMKHIKSRRMINMDCGSSHSVCVSSVGSTKCSANKSFDTNSLNQNEQAIALTIDGGLGGHGGLMINAGRACAGTIMSALLNHLIENEVKYKIVYIKTSDHSIINYAQAVIVVEKSTSETIKTKLSDYFNKMNAIYSLTDPDIALNICDTNAKTAISELDSKSFTKLLFSFNTGVFREDYAHKNSVITSAAINQISLVDGNGKIDFSIRSVFDVDRQMLFNKQKQMVNSLGFELNVVDEYCGWQEKEESAFREKFNNLHKKLFNTELNIERIHGGIEVGVIMGAIPDMDAVGISPSTQGAHSTKECLFINEVKPFWELLLAVLGEKSVQICDATQKNCGVYK